MGLVASEELQYAGDRKLKSVSLNKTLVMVNKVIMLSKFLADFIWWSRETTQREIKTEGQLGIAAIDLDFGVFILFLSYLIFFCLIFLLFANLYRTL